MNSRQKAGIGLGISGLISLAAGLIITFTGDSAWIAKVLDIFAAIAPLTGLIINFPSNTNPK